MRRQQRLRRSIPGLSQALVPEAVVARLVPVRLVAEQLLPELAVYKLVLAERAALGHMVSLRQALQLLALIPQVLALALKLRARPEQRVSELQPAAGKKPVLKRTARREFVLVLAPPARVRPLKKKMEQTEM